MFAYSRFRGRSRRSSSREHRSPGGTDLSIRSCRAPMRWFVSGENPARSPSEVFRRRASAFGRCSLAAGLTAVLAGTANADDETEQEELMNAFLELRIVPESGGFLFAGDDFPRLRWEQPYLVRELWGTFPLAVRWFDADGHEVEKPEGTGRYGAYIEGQSPDGPTFRRAKTFFRFDPATAAGTGDEIRFDLPDAPLFGMSEAAWETHRETLEDFGKDAIVQALIKDEKAAILVAGIAEWDQAADDPLDTPSIRHQDYHLELKRDILGASDRFPPLERPWKRETPAPVLEEGSAEDAGVDDDLPDRLRALCRKWERETGEPFTAVAARRGLVFFHEAFGEHEGQPVDRNTAYPLFSISKSLTGLMAALFVDQGLLEPDAPLGNILPDLPTDPATAVTLRGCLMHVTGLEGQVRWRGLENPWLDNVAANALHTVRPAHRYSGVAYDLVGMAMQVTSGKTIPRLFQEHLFQPLGMENARISGLGIGAHMRALDLARLGQLMLNGGSYGEHGFFSEATLSQILPVAYEDHFPSLASDRRDYGFGIRWAARAHPRAGDGGLPEDATILSPRTVGHGSFSGTVFRVDFDNDLVIAVGRFRPGDDHGAHVDRLFLTIAEGLRSISE